MTSDRSFYLAGSAEAWADELRLLPLDVLLELAWSERRANFAPTITFSVPGARRYDTERYVNHRHSFVEISLTGRRCALNCEHCRGKLLHHMLSARTPEELRSVAQRLMRQGCSGVLLSGGAEKDGRVEFDGFYEVIAEIVRADLRVLVHTGLLDESTARSLRQAGVHQVLVDLIGEAETIRDVYHLDRTAEDYRASLYHARQAGLSLAPHIVLGLHAGQIRGEYRALSFATEAGVDALVVVILRPLPGTPLEACQTPSADDVGRFLAIARLLNPRTPIALGCARPAGPAGAAIERIALRAGVNSLAFPTATTVRRAEKMDLHPQFAESCCSLTGCEAPGGGVASTDFQRISG